jgi:DNA-damage-inducible protein J
MKTSMISIRIQEELKAQVEAILGDMGLTMSSAIQIYLTKIIKERKIPFELTSYQPNATTHAAILESKKNASKKAKKYSDAESLINEITK